MRGFTLIELMVALGDRRAAAADRPAVVHHLPAQQRNPVDVRIARQRAARGHGRSGRPQQEGHVRARRRDGRRLEILGAGRRRLSTQQPPSRATRKKEAGPSSKITVTPAGQLTVCFNGLGRVVNRARDPNDHIRQIDIDLHRRRRGPPAADHRRRPESAGRWTAARTAVVRPRSRARRALPPDPRAC